MATIPPVPPVKLQPQPLAPQPVGPRSYLEYYTNTANDPWAGNYVGLMGQYAAVPANTPEALLTRMLLYAPSTPQAFIMVEAQQDPALLGWMMLMHCASRFPVSVPPTPWDKTVMAFEGDVLGGQICMVVEWPATGFWQASNGATLQVLKLANLDTLFDANRLVKTVGPFTANEIGTELTQMQNFMCVPPRYVLIMLGQTLPRGKLIPDWVVQFGWMDSR